MNVRLATNGTIWKFPRADSPNELEKRRSLLDDAAAAGFDGIEHLPLFTPAVDAQLLRHELKMRRLFLAGVALYGALETPAGRAKLEKQIIHSAQLNVENNADYFYVIDEMYADVVSGEMSASTNLSDHQWDYLIETAELLNHQARELCDVPVLIHPHEYTHIDNLEQIDRFLSETDSEKVSLLLDVAQYAYRGGDPVAFYLQHHERVGQIHLKNVSRSLLPEHPVPLAALVETGAFADLTTGDVDFEALREALEATDYQGWITIELLLPGSSVDRSIDVASRALQYLRETGY